MFGSQVQSQTVNWYLLLCMSQLTHLRSCMRIKMKRIKPEKDASPYQFIRPTVLTDKAELNKQQTFGGCKQARGGAISVIRKSYQQNSCQWTVNVSLHFQNPTVIRATSFQEMFYTVMKFDILLNLLEHISHESTLRCSLSRQRYQTRFKDGYGTHIAYIV